MSDRLTDEQVAEWVAWEALGEHERLIQSLAREVQEARREIERLRAENDLLRAEWVTGEKAILDVCDGLDAYQVEQALAYAYGWRAIPPFHCEDQGLAGWTPRRER